jgi:DNA invertase Pin-like site-specific DNA recombinase
MNNFIGYFRVSTQNQVRADQTSLGIEAQKTAVRNFIGDTGNLTHEYVEIESGKNNNRPILEKAIQQAEKTGATLIIAKIDRLSREVSFLFQLKDRIQNSGVKIKSLDIPDMNTLNLGIYGTIAQHERETTSLRTKNALAELVKKGVKLGTPKNLNKAAREKGQEAIKTNALNNDRNRQAQAIVYGCKERGMSFHEIADYLNKLNFRTRNNKSFFATSVKRLYDRPVYKEATKNSLK